MNFCCKCCRTCASRSGCSLWKKALDCSCVAMRLLPIRYHEISRNLWWYLPKSTLLRIPIHVVCPVKVSKSWIIYVQSPDAPGYSMKISALNSLNVMVWSFQVTVDFHSFLMPTTRYLSAAAFFSFLSVMLCQASWACSSLKYLSSSSGWVSSKEGAVCSPCTGKFTNGIICMRGG